MRPAPTVEAVKPRSDGGKFSENMGNFRNHEKYGKTHGKKTWKQLGHVMHRSNTYKQ
jgi:hypothetical protein